MILNVQTLLYPYLILTNLKSLKGNNIHVCYVENVYQGNYINNANI